MSGAGHTATHNNKAHAAGGSQEPTIIATLFTNYKAGSKQEVALSLPKLASKIRDTTAAAKGDLPWIKLARFGTLRTDAKSLRHDANVLEITGVEGDYDGEAVSFDQALDTLGFAGLKAILYTSPSHTPDKPRWRVLCPTSGPLPPQQRDGLLGRLNGLFRGVFSSESWTLSQSYYLGSVQQNPDHQVEVIDGYTIDQLGELDAGAIGKPHTKSPGGEPGRPGARLDEPALLTEIVNGTSFHFSCVRLIGKWALQKVPALEAKARLQAAFDLIPEAERGHRWRERVADIDRCLLDIYGKEAKKSDASAKSPGEADQAKQAAERIAATVAEFNGHYAVANEAGKAVVLQRGFDPVLRRRRYDRLSTRDLATLYMNDRIIVGHDDKDNPIFKAKSDVWLRHPERRQFIHGVTFDPTNRAVPGVLNLWEGFAVKPARGDWSLMRNHIEQVICDGDRVRLDYLLGWTARMLQRPAEQGEVAVVMQGGEGTGKGTFAKALMRIVGHHGLAISNGKHLVGNFNAHLRDVIFLFADEALFAGDRAHVGALKSLITEPYLTVEAKFANAIQAPNFLHVLMGSNETWVVPASQDARRFFVLEVSEAHKGDHDYFATIVRQMESGGYEAMLHDMLAYDLSRFNVRAVPQTEGLQRQRKLSLPTTEAWWMDCLERGYVFRSRLGLETTFGTWYPKISTELLFSSYLDFAKSRGERRVLTREGLGRFFGTVRAATVRYRNGVVGEHTVDVVNLHGGASRKAEPIRQERIHGYEVGTLEQAREDFTQATGIPVCWDGLGTVELAEDGF